MTRNAVDRSLSYGQPVRWWENVIGFNFANESVSEEAKASKFQDVGGNRNDSRLACPVATVYVSVTTLVRQEYIEKPTLPTPLRGSDMTKMDGHVKEYRIHCTNVAGAAIQSRDADSGSDREGA